MKEALERMPQKGAMLLIDQVEAIDETGILCVARDHAAPDFPLRINGALETASLIELGAQAAAAHASLYGMGRRHAGLLLALRGVEILSDPGAGPLAVRAERIDFNEGAAQYRFDVSEAGRPILGGEAVLKMRGAGS